MGEREGPNVCMIDELRDLTSHLIDAFCLCFTTCFFSSFILFLLHGNVRQLAFFTQTKHDIGIGTKAYASARCTRGRNRTAKRLRNMSQKRGCAKLMETHTTPNERGSHFHTKSQRDGSIQRTSVTGALRELTLAQPALLSASG